VTKQTGKHESESRDITPEDERDSLRALGIDPDKVIRHALHDELRLRRLLAGAHVSKMMRSEPLADPAVLNRRLAEAVEGLGPFAPTLRARLEELRMDPAKPTKKLTPIGKAAEAYFGHWAGYFSNDAGIDAAIVHFRAIGEKDDAPSPAEAWLLKTDPTFVRKLIKPLTNEDIGGRLGLDQEEMHRRLGKLSSKGKIQPRKPGRPKK
jgi:hypothetical protein